MYTMHGIPNCDTVKKAKKHLDSMGLEYTFIDFKKQLPTEAEIMSWKEAFGEWPVNKKGPTYRKIKEEFEKTKSDTKKIKLLIENTSAIKRPILMKKNKVVCFGYDLDIYAKL